jgi:hypothetical protein
MGPRAGQGARGHGRIPPQHQGEALGQGPRHLVGGGPDRAGHDLAIAGLRVIGIGAKREQ